MEAIADVIEEHGGDVQNANRDLPCAHLTLEIPRRPVNLNLLIHKLQSHAYGTCGTVRRPLGLREVRVFKRNINSYTYTVAAISVHTELKAINCVRSTPRFAPRFYWVSLYQARRRL